MLSSVSTLLLRLMIYRFVVYRNAIGVMNIQFAEGYKNADKGEKERGFYAVGAVARDWTDIWSWGSREEGHLEPGLERRSRSRGAELGRWSRSRGPREDRCSKEYEHEEEEGLKRT